MKRQHLGLFGKIRFRDSGGLRPMDPAISVGVQHEAMGMTPAELYFAQDLYLPIDLLRGSFSETEKIDSLEGYFLLGKVKRKLGEIHEIRKRVDTRSSQTKS